MARSSHYRGRPVSWACVALGVAGFAAGGIGLTLADWWVLGAGALVCVVAGVLALATDITADVQLDPLHQDHSDPFRSLLHGTVTDEGAAEMSGRPGLGEGPETTTPEEYVAERPGSGAPE